MAGICLWAISPAVLGPAFAVPVHFEQDVWPIIEESCLKCHRPPYKEDGRLKKPKADLILDSAKAIMQGGQDGAVVTPGKPQESSFYTLTTLDPDDEDVMPNKGETLTQDQQDIIRRWIEEGAEFGAWKGNEAGAPQKTAQVVRPEPKHPLDELYSGLRPIDASMFKRAPEATIVQISRSNPLLRAAYIRAPQDVSDRTVAKLAAFRTHITDLDLSETLITDKGLKFVASFSKLTRLDLHRTSIGDAGVAKLKPLARLNYLNLYGTKLTDKALPHLARLKGLKSLHLWDTGLSAEGVSRLRKALPDTDISFEGLLPLPAPPQPDPSENPKSRRGLVKK